MQPHDVPTVLRLVNEYLSRFDLVPVFQSEEEISWWFLPRESIVTTYVVEGRGGLGRRRGEARG